MVFGKKRCNKLQSSTCENNGCKMDGTACVPFNTQEEEINQDRIMGYHPWPDGEGIAADESWEKRQGKQCLGVKNSKGELIGYKEHDSLVIAKNECEQDNMCQAVVRTVTNGTPNYFTYTGMDKSSKLLKINYEEMLTDKNLKLTNKDLKCRLDGKIALFHKDNQKGKCGTYDNENRLGSTLYLKPGGGDAGVGVDICKNNFKANCNKMSCPYGFIKKSNASNLYCNSSNCNSSDKNTCCKKMKEIDLISSEVEDGNCSITKEECQNIANYLINRNNNFNNVSYYVVDGKKQIEKPVITDRGKKKCKTDLTGKCDKLFDEANDTKIFTPAQKCCIETAARREDVPIDISKNFKGL